VNCKVWIGDDIGMLPSGITKHGFTFAFSLFIRSLKLFECERVEYYITVWLPTTEEYSVGSAIYYFNILPYIINSHCYYMYKKYIV
jgi:hypothetical protein